MSFLEVAINLRACLVDRISDRNSFCWEFLTEMQRLSLGIHNSPFDSV